MKLEVVVRRHIIQYATFEVSGPDVDSCNKIALIRAKSEEDVDWCDTKITRHAIENHQLSEGTNNEVQ
jgi:hypothetical protein